MADLTKCLSCYHFHGSVWGGGRCDLSGRCGICSGPYRYDEKVSTSNREVEEKTPNREEYKVEIGGTISFKKEIVLTIVADGATVVNRGEVRCVSEHQARELAKIKQIFSIALLNDAILNDGYLAEKRGKKIVILKESITF